MATRTTADKLQELGIVVPELHLSRSNVSRRGVIADLTKSGLEGLFGYRTRSNVNKSMLVRSLIWQDFLLLGMGYLDPFRGNIRSYWYQRVKPTLDRAQANNRDGYYGAMIAHFVSMVVDYQLFHYRDFGFSDDGMNNRLIGRIHPHIIVAAEKTGHFGLLMELHRDYDVTVIALGGQPSALSMEYLVADLDEAGADLDSLVVFTYVDYDAAGASIADEFVEKLHQNGVEADIARIDLADPGLIDTTDVDRNKYYLTSRGSAGTRNDQWLAETKGLEPFGVSGRYGLEADAIPWTNVIDRFTDQVEPFLTMSVEQIRRRQLIGQMLDVLGPLLVNRLVH